MSSFAAEHGDVYQEGSGEPLILLHGFGGTWRQWTPVLPYLLKHHRVIAPSLPGHFGGVDVKGKASPASIADALVAQLQSMGIKRAHVVGQSLGGYIAVEVARRGAARSVLAISPGGGWKDEAQKQKVLKKIRTGFKALPYITPILSPLLGITAVRKRLLQNEMAHPERMPAADVRGMLRSALKCKIAGEFLNGGIPAIERLPPRVNIPLRVLWCEHDKVLTFNEFGQPFLDALGLRTHGILPGCGHNPMYDDPAGVARAILEFTQSVERAAPL
jgi:pimeloyl-ACP methyl ester carboxylesterase